VNTSKNDNMITVHKAIYFCSCTREYLDTLDIPKECPTCFSGCLLSRVETYQADRTVENGRIVYPEVKDL
jgi:hypothetical protein